MTLKYYAILVILFRMYDPVWFFNPLLPEKPFKVDQASLLDITRL